MDCFARAAARARNCAANSRPYAHTFDACSGAHMRHVAGMCRSRWWVLRKHVKEISGSAGSRMYAVYWVRCSVHHCRPCTVPLYTPISFGDVHCRSSGVRACIGMVRSPPKANCPMLSWVRRVSILQCVRVLASRTLMRRSQGSRELALQHTTHTSLTVTLVTRAPRRKALGAGVD